MARILVVDDDPSILDMYRVILEKEGRLVDSALNAEDALVLAEQNPPDLLITDFDMPGMKGDELSEKMFEKIPGLPIIMITSSEIPQGYRHPTLSKPVSMHVLVKTVEYWLDQ